MHRSLFLPWRMGRLGYQVSCQDCTKVLSMSLVETTLILLLVVDPFGNLPLVLSLLRRSIRRPIGAPSCANCC